MGGSWYTYPVCREFIIPNKIFRILNYRLVNKGDADNSDVIAHLQLIFIELPEIAQALEFAEESAYTPGELNLYES